MVNSFFNPIVAGIFIVFAFASCYGHQKLVEGEWKGSISPQNHPEMKTPISYEISYDKDQLNMSLIGPDGNRTKLSNITRVKKHLEFQFNEPEQNVLLTCDLIEQSDNSYQGKCKDVNGKWALFTLISKEQ